MLRITAHRASFAITVLLLACSCATIPPVFRSKDYGPTKPVPTLLTSSAFYFDVKRTIVNVDASTLSSESIARSLKSVAMDALSDSKQMAEAYEQVKLVLAGDGPSVAELVKRMADAIYFFGATPEMMATKEFMSKLVAESAPAMHEAVVELLESQGFSIEYDLRRSYKLADARSSNRSKTYDWVARDTVARPFGGFIPGKRDGGRTEVDWPGQFPLFGDGSKADVVETLGPGRENEVYASVEVQFHPTSALPLDMSEGVTCIIAIYVLDQQGNLVYQAYPKEFAEGATPKEAFAKALELAQHPVVE